jgi:hypothetical protein
MKLYLFLEAQDRVIAKQIGLQLRQKGHDVEVNIRDTFHTADPLAMLLSSLRQRCDRIVVIVSRLSHQAEWVLRELRTQRNVASHEHRQVIFTTIFINEEAVPSWLNGNDQPYIICNPEIDLVNYIEDN